MSKDEIIIRHDHGVTEDEHDWEILKLANEKGKFAIELGVIMCEHLQLAFERGIDGGWWMLVDVSFIAEIRRGNPMRIFKLTDVGERRRAMLQKLYDKPATH